MKSYAIFAGLALCLSLASPGRGAVYTNTIYFFAFDPPTRTVAPGDTVVWVNLDGVGHTVTGDTKEEPICGSDYLSPGGRCMRTFNTIGTFTYHCEPHESMVGTIVVEAPVNLPPNVVITSPTNGASFAGPTNVLVRATATDPDGAVTLVTFFGAVTTLGSDTSAPFQVNPYLGVGQHVLTATAFDDSGAQSTSPPIRITISPPLRILRLSGTTNLVLTSAPTNYLNLQPEYTTNVNGTNWLALTVRSNRVASGAVETFCGRPVGNSVFIRIRSP